MSSGWSRILILLGERSSHITNYSRLLFLGIVNSVLKCLFSLGGTIPISKTILRYIIKYVGFSDYSGVS